MKTIIVYYSRGGTTKKIAERIAEALASEKIEARVLFCEDVAPKELLDYEGIIIGSPTYYGTMASEIKKLLDDTVSFHGKLDGKAGGAFSSSANLAGGNETTLLSILEAMLIHGMVLQGDPKGDHYGPVALGKIDQRCEDNIKRFASRFATLIRKLNS